MSKYGMSMCVLGMAEEFKENGIAVNAVWPKTGTIYFYEMSKKFFQFINIDKYENN